MPVTVHGYLEVLRPQGDVGSLFPVRSGRCTVGRGSDCSVRIHHPSISDTHCLITSHANKESTIQNLGFTNGTFLNGKSIDDKVEVLHHDDVITMAERSFLWKYPESSKFWINSGRQNVKISPTVISLTPKKVTPSPKLTPWKIPSAKVSAVQHISMTPPSSTSNQLLDSSSKSTKTSVIKKSPPQSSSIPRVNSSWLHASSSRRTLKERTRATLSKCSSRSSSSLEFPIESKNMGCKTPACDMLSSLQNKISGLGLGDSSTSCSKHTIYGELLALRMDGSIESRLPLSTEECIIGRGLDSDIRIARANISDKHCLIASKLNQQSTLTDLSTFSNTLLNGNTLTNGRNQLHHGDVITVGDKTFCWEYPKSSQFWTNISQGRKKNDITKTHGREKGSKMSVPADAVSKPGKHLHVAGRPSECSKDVVECKSSAFKAYSLKVPLGLSTLTLPKSKKTSSLPIPLTQDQVERLAAKHGSLYELSVKPKFLKGVAKKKSGLPFLNPKPNVMKNKLSSIPKLLSSSSTNVPLTNNKSLSRRKVYEQTNVKSGLQVPIHTKTVSQLSTLQRTRSVESLSPTSSSSESDEKQSRLVSTISPQMFKETCFTAALQQTTQTMWKASEAFLEPRTQSTASLDEDIDDQSASNLIDPMYSLNQ